jgi:formylglycine-generating enzyme required for sulfatase activity
VFTSPVGSFKANAYGLYDMIGNVSQWSGDRYADYEKGAGTDPTGADTGIFRVLRGGSWYSDPGYCRSATRDGHYPGYRFGYFGFRVAVVAAGVD